MAGPVYGPKAPNADDKFNELRHSFRHTIPRHMANVRHAIIHLQHLRRLK